MKIDNVDESPIQQPYKTSDLALTTTLSLYFPIRTIDRDNPCKVIFLFDLTDELSAFVNRFWRNEVSVEPQTFFNQLKTIKTRIYANS